jgi:hypothetical protein
MQDVYQGWALQHNEREGWGDGQQDKVLGLLNYPQAYLPPLVGPACALGEDMSGTDIFCKQK